MNINVIPVRTKPELKEFILLPRKIYKDDKCWVPPLINDLKKMLTPFINPETRDRQCELYLAFLDGVPVGRVFVAFDEDLNMEKKVNAGYFSMFECIDNACISRAIFNKACSWFMERNINLIRGPVSIDGADRDEYKGLLIDAFDKPPVLFNSYNPKYYIKLFKEFSFEKDYDVFAYYLNKDALFGKDPTKIIEYAKKKFNFRIDTINLKEIDKEIDDIKHIVDLAMPEDWDDLIPPSIEDIRIIAKDMISLVDPDLIAIARTREPISKPVGFAVALPDYNQVLIHLNGRITPFSILKYIWYKKKINGARVFIMFVVPEYRKKGVAFAIYHSIFLNGLKKGYVWGEGSTIGEENRLMRTDIESMGGQKYKTYRIFKKYL